MLYDADGSLTAGAGNGYAYNGTDQTTSFTPMGAMSATTVGYFGSTQNERSSFGSTTYVNGPQGVQSMTGGGSSTYYDRTPDGQLVGEHGPDGDFYYAFDNQGSVTALISTNGTGTSSYRYDPFGGNVVIGGSTTVANDNPWRFTGAYYDRLTGVYHLGARYYDPTLGRFTQQDTIDHLADPTQGNKYAYAGDDPIGNNDPSGNNAFDSITKVVATGLGIAVTVADLTGIGAASGVDPALSAASVGVDLFKTAGDAVGAGDDSVGGDLGADAVSGLTLGVGSAAGSAASTAGEDAASGLENVAKREDLLGNANDAFDDLNGYDS